MPEKRLYGLFAGTSKRQEIHTAGLALQQKTLLVGTDKCLMPHGVDEAAVLVGAETTWCPGTCASVRQHVGRKTFPQKRCTEEAVISNMTLLQMNCCCSQPPEQQRCCCRPLAQSNMCSSQFTTAKPRRLTPCYRCGSGMAPAPGVHPDIGVTSSISRNWFQVAVSTCRTGNTACE